MRRWVLQEGGLSEISASCDVLAPAYARRVACAAAAVLLLHSLVSSYLMSASRRDANSTRFIFCSQEGRSLVSDTIESVLHYRPHDYQLEGVCKSLDGVDLLAIMATGSGKTAYLTMYMLLLQELGKESRSLRCDGVVVPRRPAMMIVYPTIGLESEMVSARLRFAEALTFTIYSPLLYRRRRSKPLACPR